MRPNKDQYFLTLAIVTAERSTCMRRKVGCVLVDDDNYIISTGYNGVPRGARHCNENAPCAAVGASSGTQLDECNAIHAEQNAIAHCEDPKRIAAAYITVSPCMSCMKLLLATDCERIVVPSVTETYDEKALDLWYENHRTFKPVNMEDN